MNFEIIVRKKEKGEVVSEKLIKEVEIKRAVEDLTLKQDALNSGGNNNNNSNSGSNTDKTELMIIGAVAIIALALITKK